MAYKVVVLPGDGVGPEVAAQGVKVLQAVSENYDVDFEVIDVPCGARYYKEHGEEWPDGSFETCRDESDAILLGAIGWPGVNLPSGDIAGAGIVFGLRFGLDLYANVRPCMRSTADPARPNFLPTSRRNANEAPHATAARVMST